jgi:molybdopterin-guanine dinucleotide biosynthesis protein A
MIISAAILTGGKNSRMNGEFKALLDICGTKIIDKQLKVLSSIFDDIFICGKDTGYQNNIPVFEDDFFDFGPISGIYSALKHSKTDYVFVVSCDMPFLNKDTIKEMIEYCSNNKDTQILIPEHKKGLEPLHALYHKSMLPIIHNQINSGNLSIRKCFSISKTQKFIVNLQHNPTKSFFNVNNPEDLEKAEKLCITN